MLKPKLILLQIYLGIEMLIFWLVFPSSAQLLISSPDNLFLGPHFPPPGGFYNMILSPCKKHFFIASAGKNKRVSHLSLAPVKSALLCVQLVYTNTHTCTHPHIHTHTYPPTWSSFTQSYKIIIAVLMSW